MELLGNLHEAMLTNFERGEGLHMYTRHVHRSGRLELEEISCAEDSQTLLHQIRDEHRLDILHSTISPFGAWPLARATVLRASDKHRLLVFSGHHLVFDGMSAALYWRQLVTLYTSPDAVREIEVLRARVRPYSDFVQLQHEKILGPSRAALLDFWKRYLAELHIDTTPLDIETLALPPAVQRRFELDAGITRAISMFAYERALTPHLVLMACLQWAFHARDGNPDVLTLTPTKNRPRAFAETVGCFMNPVVVRQRIDRTAALEDLLTALRTSASSAYRHAQLPIGHVVRELFPAMLASGVPLWRSWFGIQVPMDDFQVCENFEFKLYPLTQARTAGKGLSIELIAERGCLKGLMLANAHVPDAFGAVDQFVRLIELVVARPRTALESALGETQ